MTTQFKLHFLLNHQVQFRTYGNFEKIGEVRVLGNGKMGITTQTEVFPAHEVKRIRRVRK